MMKTEYVLDFAKWRAGSNGPNMLGVGIPRMLNAEGYMCCLGQFTLQYGVTPTGAYPRHTADACRKVYDPNMVKQYQGRYVNTELANELALINDFPFITTEERIKKIRATLEEAGHTLKVLNLSTELQHLAA